MKWISGLVVLAVLLCSGCKTSHVSITGDKTKTLGTLIAWDPSWSAAMVLPADGERPDRMCMQNALGMKAFSAKGGASADATVLALATAAAAAVEKGGDGVTIGGEFAQAITVLSTSTERTAFLNLGMFHICQLGANGTLTPADAKVLISELIVASAALEQNPKK